MLLHKLFIDPNDTYPYTVGKILELYFDYQNFFYKDYFSGEELTKRVCKYGSFYYTSGIAIHRMDGPAIVFTDGTEHYFINDVEYSKDHFLRVRELINFI